MLSTVKVLQGFFLTFLTFFFVSLFFSSVLDPERDGLRQGRAAHILHSRPPGRRLGCGVPHSASHLWRVSVSLIWFQAATLLLLFCGYILNPPNQPNHKYLTVCLICLVGIRDTMFSRWGNSPWTWADVQLSPRTPNASTRSSSSSCLLWVNTLHLQSWQRKWTMNVNFNLEMKCVPVSNQECRTVLIEYSCHLRVYVHKCFFFVFCHPAVSLFGHEPPKHEPDAVGA